MAELLLELLSEEIPARMQVLGEEQLKTKCVEAFRKIQLPYDAIQTYSTPRRLVIIIDGLPIEQPAQFITKKGPRCDAPDNAVQGFAKSLQISSQQLVAEDNYWWAKFEEPGRKILPLLAELLPQILGQLHWPKTMIWGKGTTPWPRPLRHILAIFDQQIVPFCFAEVTAGNITYGLRSNTASIIIEDSSDYGNAMVDNGVILPRAQRQIIIEKEAKALAQISQVVWQVDDTLMQEVIGLVENPTVLMGTIDPKFMQLPSALLTVVMRHHQRYFTVLDKSGNLAPYFMTVSNILPVDGGKTIIQGNERVLRARLEDAQFHYNQDRQQSLIDHASKLQTLLFKTDLGSMAEKVQRIAPLALFLNDQFNFNLSHTLIQQTAMLLKADLCTGLVSEFPELQGKIGAHYAELDGHETAVVTAIQEQYLLPHENIPENLLSIVMALADKFDTLSGFFKINQAPTGSKDPFALRRAALSILRVIHHHQLSLPLKSLFSYSLSLYDETPNPLVIDTLLQFFYERFNVQCKEQGTAHDIIQAVLEPAKLQQNDNIVFLKQQIEAIENFLTTEAGTKLRAVLKRVFNILKIEEQKDKTTFSSLPDTTQFGDLEHTVYQQCLTLAQQKEFFSNTQLLAPTTEMLHQLTESITHFLDQLMINDPLYRINRLNLLAMIRFNMNRIADFSQLEG